MAKLPGFIGPSAVSVSSVASCERTRNFYIERLPPSGKNQFALYPSPGRSIAGHVPQVNGRALYEMNGLCLAVVGTTAYSIDSTYTGSAIGTVTLNSNPAQIVSNGATGGQFLFGSGGNAYCYNPSTSAFTQVLSGDAAFVGMLDSFGVALDPTTSTFHVSATNDFTSWPGANFVQRTDAPDNWVSMVVNIPDVWLIGEQTGVVYYDAGTFPVPLAQRPGATFKYGIVAPWTLKTSAGFTMWLARNEAGAGQVVLAVGYSPQPVSTPEVDAAIAQYARTSTITDAEAMMFSYYGHLFYVLTFPSARATWVYDVSTGFWVEWGKWNSPMSEYEIWEPRVHCYAFGQHLTLDRATGNISLLDSAYGTEADGSVIRRERITPSVFNENRQIAHRRVEVFLESGLGTQTGQGANPLITMQTSDDGGKTYLPERSASAGKVGEYFKRVFWTRLGVPRDRVYKFVMTDPITWRLIDGFLNNDAPQGARRAA